MMDNILPEFKKGELNLNKKAKRVFHFWIKHREIIFIIISLIIFILSLYFSYVSLYKNPWDEEKKNQYILSRRREINFREEKFKQVIGEIDRKKENFQKNFPPVKDIFKPLEE